MSSSNNDDVEVLPQPRIITIPFAVKIPASALQDGDEAPTLKRDAVALMGDNGIVGTIVFLRNAVNVWVGWGKLDLMSGEKDAAQAVDCFGKGRVDVMIFFKSFSTWLA